MCHVIACVLGGVGFTVVDNTGPGCGVPGSMENTGSRGLWKTRGPGACWVLRKIQTAD